MLYDYPEYYEIAVSFRDIPTEVNFIDRCIKQLSDIEVAKILEIASGHAPHAGEIIKNGYEYYGLDINRNMLDFATYKWKNLNHKPNFIEADMLNFELPHKIDFAFVLLGSLYLKSKKDMESHFNCVSKCLEKGGLYFLDWCIQFADPLLFQNNNNYSIEHNGIIIDSEFKLKLIDQQERMYEEIWTVNVNDHGRHKTFNMIERNKAILPEEFKQFLKQRNDFEFVGWWQSWDLSDPIKEGQIPNRPVCIIKKA